MKELNEGELDEITGHLMQSENNFGRSKVIDLNAPAGFNVRLVDHRTIEYIIFKNIKYVHAKKNSV